MVRWILNDKGEFYIGSESDDSDNDDENYNDSSSYMRVLPIVSTK